MTGESWGKPIHAPLAIRTCRRTIQIMKFKQRSLRTVARRKGRWPPGHGEASDADPRAFFKSVTFDTVSIRVSLPLSSSMRVLLTVSIRKLRRVSLFLPLCKYLSKMKSALQSHFTGRNCISHLHFRCQVSSSPRPVSCFPRGFDDDL